MDSPTLLRRMHDHRRWANARLLKAARSLTEVQLQEPFSIGRDSVWATLVHLYQVEVVWLAVLEGQADAQPGNATAPSTLAELAEAWTAHEARWQAHLAGLDEMSLDQSIERVNSRGERSVFTVGDALVHVCTHAQYTSAQAVNMLRQLGCESDALPDLQLITLSRAEAQA
jgi:uncharacterized damage-inducible protein DinB